MKILLLGSQGQVGWQLRRSLGLLGDVIALARDEGGDLRRADEVAAAIARLRPAAVVNAAAYTAVDRAEDEPEVAHAINAHAPRVIAEATARIGAWLVHYSTDYVYDGSGDAAWREDAPTGPLGVYGSSKLAGDRAIALHNPRHLIFRTSWVFDSWGQNFAKSILKAAAARDELKVVADQWGAPTRAALIADVTAAALRQVMAASGAAPTGVFHLAAAGVTNWHAYAQLLVEEGWAQGLQLRARPEAVLPIPSSGYPTRARRPYNSRLDTSRLRAAFGLTLPPWDGGARGVVAEIAQPSPLPSRGPHA